MASAVGNAVVGTLINKTSLIDARLWKTPVWKFKALRSSDSQAVLAVSTNRFTCSSMKYNWQAPTGASQLSHWCRAKFWAGLILEAFIQERLRLVQFSITVRTLDVANTLVLIYRSVVK